MIPRILTKVFDTPWVIKPDAHYAIQRVIANKVFHGPKLQDGTDTLPDGPAQDVPQVPSIAIISVAGILGKHLGSLETMCGGYDVDALANELKQARDNPAVVSVVLWFDSPGGTVTGVPEVAELIAQVDKVKPVYAFTDSLCASGAYWLASQCRSIVATPSADLGSIGVYLALLDESKALEIEGVKVNAIYKGDYKLAGASFKPLTDDERAMFQAGVDKIYHQFTGAVTSKRAIGAKDMQGQCFDGEDAVTRNLADGLVNDLDQFLSLIGGKLTA